MCLQNLDSISHTLHISKIHMHTQAVTQCMHRSHTPVCLLLDTANKQRRWNEKRLRLRHTCRYVNVRIDEAGGSGLFLPLWFRLPRTKRSLRTGHGQGTVVIAMTTGREMIKQDVSAAARWRGRWGRLTSSEGGERWAWTRMPRCWGFLTSRLLDRLSAWGVRTIRECRWGHLEPQAKLKCLRK